MTDERVVQLQVLGSLAASLGSRDVTGAVSQPKRLALMTWLELSRPHGLHPRDTLCGLLWPESPNDKARTALRQLLLVLRRDLGEDLFLSEGELVGINPQRLTSDAGAVLDALERGDDRAAMFGYRGDLLPALPFDDNEHFERWVEQRRQDLRRAVVQAAWREVDRAETKGDNIAARKDAEWAVALDSDDENGLRRVMALQARTGDRAEALRSYERYTRRLREDWSVEPEDATRTLFERIRNGDVVASPVSLSRSAPSPETTAVKPGIRSPSTGKRWRFVVAGVLACLALLFAARRGVDDSIVPGRVLVVPFQNLTTDSTLNVLGVLAADWVIQDLQRSGTVEVVDPATAFLSTRERTDKNPASMLSLRELARPTGAALVVVGSITAAGDSLEYAARLVDLRNARVLQVMSPIRASRADPTHALDEIRRRLAGAVAVEIDQPRIPASRGETPPTLDAYQEFVAGLDDFVAVRNTQGRARFEEAVRRDPTFTLARIWLYYSLTNGDILDSARGVVRGIREMRQSLSPVVRLWLEMDSLEQAEVPLEQLLRPSERAARLSPGSHNEWNLALGYIALRRPQEAIEIFRRFGRQGSWFTRWPRYWYHFGSALHLAGDFQAETQLYADGAPREETVFHQIIGRAALGQSESVRALLDSALQANTGALPYLVGVAAFLSGAELESHGFPVEGIRLLQWADSALEARRQWDVSVEATVDLAIIRTFLGEYLDDPALAAWARMTLHSIAASPASATPDARFGLILATCSERDSGRIRALRDPVLPQRSGVSAIIEVCSGNLNAALEAVDGAADVEWFYHSLPHLRTLRSDPRFKAWLYPAP